MPDITKTITGLRLCLGAETDDKCPEICPYFNDCAGDIPHRMHEDALELLEANEPVMPDCSTRVTISGKRVQTCYCGKCGKEIIYKGYQYCPYCGKAVKWE